MAKKGKHKEIDLIRDGMFPFAEAKVILTTLLSGAESDITQKDRMNYSLQLALAEQSLGNIPESIRLLADCEKYITTYGLPEEKSTMLFLRAMHLSGQALFEEAMTVGLRALHLSQGLDIPLVTLRGLICCGRICFRMLLYTEAMDYMSRGLALAREIDHPRQIILFMYQLVDIKKQLLEPAEAIKEVEALAAYKKQTLTDKPDIGYAIICESVARTAMEIGDVKKAKEYMKSAISIRQQLPDDSSLISDHYSVLGKICTAENDEKGMLRYTQIAIDISKSNVRPLAEFYAWQERFNHYLLHGKIKDAKKQLDLMSKAASEVSTTLTSHELDTSSLKYYEKIGNHDQELIYMRKIYDYRMRAQQRVMAHRLHHLAAVQELEIMAQENEVIKKELNLKSQELNLSNHHLQQRNDLLKELKESINSLKKENTKREVVFQTLFRKIDIAFNKEENEKDVFSSKFDSTNAEFIRNLSSRYPKLSTTECRISALLHSGFNTKEIATLLSTSLRNIETHRLNIRKKLGLKRNDNLQLVLASIKG